MEVDHEINEGDSLPFLPGLQVIFAPGHSDGQVVFLWPEHGGVLIAADTCAHFGGLGPSVGYENFEIGKQTLKKLCNYDFSAAVFGHGIPILENAGNQWRQTWSTVS